MNILFLVTDFAVGGITSSLVNLTSELVARGHDVSILNLPKATERPAGMSAAVRFVELTGKARLWNLSMTDVQKVSGMKKLVLLCLGLVKKLLNRCHCWTSVVFSGLHIPGRYDYAVAFRQEPTSIWLVKHKVSTCVKVVFWHSDPNVEDTSAWDKCLYDMDVVAGVSDYVCEALRQHHPGLVTKTVYNLFNAACLIERANDFDAGYDERFNIVTVSRIDFFAKNLHMIPVIAARLKQAGLDFCWTVVGDGPDMPALRCLVEENGVTDCVKLVGMMGNPYPYIKQADLFVLTSAWESYGMVVMEALILHTPVVAGDYPALKEILTDGMHGVIAENSIDGIYEAVYRLMTQKDVYAALKSNCEAYSYSSDGVYQQFLQLGET